uniref:Uncharacterized protein n=1 Tax=Arundo donax TaxID=35708 RepID=A0A0A9AE36_ARUDO
MQRSMMTSLIPMRRRFTRWSMQIKALLPSKTRCTYLRVYII